MATHYDDEAQIDALRKWWKDNWVALAAGLGIGLGAIFGWEGYKRHGEGYALRAAELYGELQSAQAASDGAAVLARAETLRREFGSSPYAALAQLHLAQQSARDGDLAAARQALSWVESQAGDAGLKAIAGLRLARVELQQGALDEALQRLTSPPAGFEALYLELRGDVLLAKGDRSAARAAYEDALAGLEAGAPYRGLLQQKIDDLTEVAAS